MIHNVCHIIRHNLLVLNRRRMMITLVFLLQTSHIISILVRVPEFYLFISMHSSSILAKLLVKPKL